jgi:hypothetical protein
MQSPHKLNAKPDIGPNYTEGIAVVKLAKETKTIPKVYTEKLWPAIS